MLLPDGDLDWLRNEASREEAQNYYSGIWQIGKCDLTAELGRGDRYFLLTWILNRADANHDWLYARCREVEKEPDSCLDLWAREHYKSTIITFAGAIQEIVRDPEVTIGIFSHNNSTARKFLRQIKYECESNPRLKAAYPDIFWKKPDREAPRWSEERGIIVKRKRNPKEGTVEAHGLIDGMPTGAHYRLRIYNDVVTEDSVTTPEMMAKTTDAWKLSQNLGMEGGRMWHEGTRYHFNDTYRYIMDTGRLNLRVYPATDDGTPSGKPVLVSEKSLVEKRELQGPYIFSCQQLLNPVADEAQGFKREWLKFYSHTANHEFLNKYILVDPANEKKKNSDYTAMWVIGLGSDRNYYLLEAVRDRINLTQRADILFDLHRRFKPLGVGYEKYGKDSDIQHFEDRQNRENYRFSIQALGGKVKKEDRVRKLVPLFETGRIWLPEVLYRMSDGKKVDLVKTFIESEYLAFPVAIHDDMLDCLARIVDPDFPTAWPDENLTLEGKPRDAYAIKPKRSQGTWMSI